MIYIMFYLLYVYLNSRKQILRGKVHFGGIYKYLRYFEFAEVTAKNHKFAYTHQVKNNKGNYSYTIRQWFSQAALFHFTYFLL
jgi:hypothetical protein